MPIDAAFMDLAIQLATENVLSGAGGPFGAVIVRNGEVIATGANSVTESCDPTAHAEVLAIRNACRELKSFQLKDCEIYTSCEPCPMCMGAIYWARLSAVYYANTKTDAAEAGFDDAFIYREFAVSPEQRSLAMIHLPRTNATQSFECWKQSGNKTDY